MALPLTLSGLVMFGLYLAIPKLWTLTDSAYKDMLDAVGLAGVILFIIGVSMKLFGG